MNKIELVCLTKNQRPNDLKEFCDYHLAIGFDRINLFDNNSSFSVTELFSKYDNVSVTVVKENCGTETNFKKHYNIYNEICHNKINHTEWLCFIDDDEFIYIKDNKNIKEILRDDLPAMSIFWKMISLPYIIEDRETTLIDTFNYTSKNTEWSNNSFVKTMINLNICKNINWGIDPHAPSNIQCFEFNGNPLRGNHIITDNFYDNQSVIIYHYYHQSWQDWLFKINRGGLSNGQTYRSNSRQFFNDMVSTYKQIDNSMIDRKKILGGF
jgi:hypothetical protein